METIEKPKYLGLLNRISNAETAAGVYLRAWADVTPNADLACTLRLVAARESSHGETFCRRISELGFELRKDNDPKGYEILAKLANPNISDLEKIGDRDDRSDNNSDPFAEIRRRIAEGEFDPMTANMLTWYIAEEADSGRRLRECYDCVREMSGHDKKAMKAAPAMAPAMAAGPSADAEAIMACMTSGFKSLEKSLEKLAKAAAK
jgi:hypothetical protein